MQIFGQEGKARMTRSRALFRHAGAVVLVMIVGGAPGSWAQSTEEDGHSFSAAPFHRPADNDTKTGYPPEGKTAGALQRGIGTDVFGAEVNSRDAMVMTNVATPGTITVLAALGPGSTGPNGDFVQGCDFDSHGNLETLYCIEGTGGFFSVDVGTGSQSLIGVAATQAPDGVFTGLASDPVTGTMFVVATSESSPGSGNCAADSGLYSIDIGTGGATRIGPIPDLSCVIAAGFDNSGQLYAYGVVSNNLVAIDKSSGASTLIGSLGFDPNFAQGMDFDSSTNTCYLFAFNADNAVGFEGELRTCDTGTGASVAVGSLGTPGDFSEISGAGIAHVPALFADGFESGDTTAWE